MNREALSPSTTSESLGVGPLVQATNRLEVEQGFQLACPSHEAAERVTLKIYNEPDLRSLKSSMQMSELRCKTPEWVHKDVWLHILAYNLIRTVMALAAARHGVAPRTISFTGAIQTLEAFQPLLDFGVTQEAASRLRLYHDLLAALATPWSATAPTDTSLG